MNEAITEDIAIRMQKRGERTVLHLRKDLGLAHFRYILAERLEEGAPMYSIYAEFKDEELHTVGSIPDFSPLRETAEAFCRLLARTLATPLSLEAIYEDTFTP